MADLLLPGVSGAAEQTLRDDRQDGFWPGPRWPLADVFQPAVGLWVAEGLVDAGVVAIDGTKVAANTSAWANRIRKQLAEAEQVDTAEDEQLGERRGDELPERWSDRQTANPTHQFSSSQALDSTP